jgi:class 3 adenylate cyclase
MTDKNDNLYNAIFGIMSDRKPEPTKNLYDAIFGVTPDPKPDLLGALSVLAGKPPEEKPSNLTSLLGVTPDPKPNLLGALSVLAGKPPEEKPSNLTSLFGVTPDPYSEVLKAFSLLASKPSEEKPSSLSALGKILPPPSPGSRAIEGLSSIGVSRLAGLAGIAPPIPTPPPAIAPRIPSRIAAASAGSVAGVQAVVNALLKKKAEVNDGRVLPNIEDLAVMEGRRIRAAFVYSDLHGFTKLVASQPTNKSFQFLHSFVYVTSLLTKHYNGQVMDCAGDRVLSVFHRSPGDQTNEPVEDAVTFALWLQTIFANAIAPTFKGAGFDGLSVAIGVDYGEAVVGCVGFRNDKRIVFFGDAANKAAKLQELAGAGETVISFAAATRRPGYLNGETWKARSEIQNGEFVQRISQIFLANEAPRAR